ncbi:hypothetical protein TWF506_005904 [Arthrobotrys conoides]|uniref:F-box domain-containing protein n=1 Tax=Arthrobotrys conoides TaxID=74498 RepID=A0AAN8NKK1_9PEZI
MYFYHSTSPLRTLLLPLALIPITTSLLGILQYKNTRTIMKIPSLPLELQLQILEASDFTDLPTLSRVCSTWRNHIFESPAILSNRYTYYFQPDSQPKPVYFHKLLHHLTHFIRFEDNGKLYPCYVEFNDVEEGTDVENGDTTQPSMEEILKSTTVTKVDYRIFGGDSSFLPTAKVPPTVLPFLKDRVPSELVYLDIGHPSVLWKTVLPEDPDAVVLTISSDASEGEEGEEGEEGGEYPNAVVLIISSDASKGEEEEGEESEERGQERGQERGDDPDAVVLTISPNTSECKERGEEQGEERGEGGEEGGGERGEEEEGEEREAKEEEEEEVEIKVEIKEEEEEGEKEEKGGVTEDEGGFIDELFKILSYRANLRYVAEPQNKSASVMVVKLALEAYEYPTMEFPPTLEFASMAEDMRLFRPGRVKKIVRLVV